MGDVSLIHAGVPETMCRRISLDMFFLGALLENLVIAKIKISFRINGSHSSLIKSVMSQYWLVTTETLQYLRLLAQLR